MFILLLSIIYLSFISLGLPDSLLGAAWPLMQIEMNVPLSYAGIISMIISLGTIISSLFSDYLSKKFSVGLITAVSVLMTAFALLGFSFSSEFYMLCLWAIPYGLGAGSVDAALNNYVALHYKSQHMNWLHCMWGVGASIGPYIMTYALTSTEKWNNGYLYIALIQFVLTLFIFLSIPLWKKNNLEKEEKSAPLSIKQVFLLKGAVAVMITFFCYCALECVSMLWSASYLVKVFDIDEEKASSLAGLFYLGLTGGRFISGFISMKLSDKNMIRVGGVIVLIGIIILFIPNFNISCVGLVVAGLGCAPVYPCIIHSTPEHFGKDKSQALIGIQMASAYLGTCLMPPLFGLLGEYISMNLFPVMLLILLIIMIFMHEVLILKTKK